MGLTTPRSLKVLIIPSSPRRFLLALAGISILTSKLTHLREHLLIDPLSAEFLVLLPTFFLYDIFIFLSIGYALYQPSIKDIFFSVDDSGKLDDHPQPKSLVQRCRSNTLYRFVAAILRITLIIYGAIFPFVIYIAASSEVSFYYQSGQMVMWSMTGRIIRDPKSFAGMATEGTGAIVVALVLIFVLARIERTITDTVVGYLSKCIKRVRGVGGTEDYERAPNQDVESYYTTDDDKSEVCETDKETSTFHLEGKTFHSAKKMTFRKWLLAGSICTTILLIMSMFRPDRRYDDVVITVPLNMLDALDDPENHHSSTGGNEDFCGAGDDQVGNGLLDFPYPNLVRWGDHDKADADYEWFTNFLPKSPPKGFERHTKAVNDRWRKWGKFVRNMKNKQKPVAPKRLPGGIDPFTPPTGYHQAYDPLKLSNYHLDLHPELRSLNPQPNDNTNITTKPLKDIKIRNVVLITMESCRMNVFPIRNETRFAEDIYKSRDANKEYADVLQLTPFAEKLVGKEQGKGGTGGIVMEGALTNAEFTLKSLLVSHCGLNPLAVDFMEELEGKQYQACLPQIFKLLNDQKAKNKGPDQGNNATDWKDSRWMTHYLQSVTTGFDRQTNELQMMGFDTKSEMVTKETMEKSDSKFPLPTTEKTLNYFGYKEQVTMPYIKDLIRTAKKTNQRLFLSHLTSTMHHPWAVPEDVWRKGNFLDDNERNNYLNTVGFVDHWLGQVMDTLEEEGIANETLVIFLGDHGLAIGEGGNADSGRVSTFANPHVNNFRIPTVFHHPELPPVHITANSTNLSILPTILDLLLNSDSLPDKTVDKRILTALRSAYEGQSLIRPLVHKTRFGLENYNFAVLNPGGTHLVVTSSDPATPYRLVMPLCNQKSPFAVSNLREDDFEEDMLRQWKTADLYVKVEERWGKDAREWTERALETGRWWLREGRRRWNYKKAARNDDRNG